MSRLGAWACFTAATLAMLPAASAGGSVDHEDDLVYAGGLTADCAIESLDVGRLEASWALTGFYPNEIDAEGQSFAWSRPDAEFALLLERSGARRLDLRLRSVAGLVLEVSANDVALGPRVIDTAFAEVSWAVPEGVWRPGLNRVRLQTTAPVRLPRDRRWLAVALDRVSLEGARAPCAATVHYAVGDTALTLPPGAIWAVARALPPRATLRVHAAGEAGALVDFFEVRGTQSRLLVTLEFPVSGRTSSATPLARYGGVDGGVVAVARGAGAVTIRSAILAGDDTPFGWRWDSGLFFAYAGIVAFAAFLFVASGRYGLAPPWPVVFDLIVVAVTAAAARYLYVSTYPGIDPDRFADAWEYLRRARFLKDGIADAWSDTAWHGWQSWIRPPGYYLLLAVLDKPYEGGLNALSTLQGSFHVVIAASTYGLARTLFGRGAALCAGLGYACYLEALVSASLVSSETLFLVLAVPGLWALAVLARRPSFASAALAGGLLGVATLVRSTPFFFLPMAAVLLLAIHGRRGREPALTLLLFAGMTIVPWCVRNSIVRGVVSGVDDIAIPNFLFAHPDPEQIALEELDLGSAEGLGAYYATLKEANREHQFDGRRGIMRAGLVRMAATPLVTVRELLASLGRCLGPLPEAWVRSHIGEVRPLRVAVLTDALNLSWFVLFGLSLAGLALSWRDRGAWPFFLWLAFGILVVNLLFPRSDVQRYRFATVPVVLAFAGQAVCELARRLERVRRENV